MDNKIISEERKKYLRKIKANKIAIVVTQILILVTFIVLWEMLANMKVINSFITSSPSRIVNTFMNMKNNNLMMHLGVTAYETIIGFLAGTIIGVIVAILLWWSDFLSKVL